MALLWFDPLGQYESQLEVVNAGYLTFHSGATYGAPNGINGAPGLRLNYANHYFAYPFGPRPAGSWVYLGVDLNMENDSDTSYNLFAILGDASYVSSGSSTTQSGSNALVWFNRKASNSLDIEVYAANEIGSHSGHVVGTFSPSLQAPHRLEVALRSSSDNSTPDGRCIVYLDGVKAVDYTGGIYANHDDVGGLTPTYVLLGDNDADTTWANLVIWDDADVSDGMNTFPLGEVQIAELTADNANLATDDGGATYETVPGNFTFSNLGTITGTPVAAKVYVDMFADGTSNRNVGLELVSGGKTSGVATRTATTDGYHHFTSDMVKINSLADVNALTLNTTDV